MVGVVIKGAQIDPSNPPLLTPHGVKSVSFPPVLHVFTLVPSLSLLIEVYAWYLYDFSFYQYLSTKKN